MPSKRGWEMIGKAFDALLLAWTRKQTENIPPPAPPPVPLPDRIAARAGLDPTSMARVRDAASAEVARDLAVLARTPEWQRAVAAAQKGQLLPPVNRGAMHPARNAGTGVVAGSIAQALTWGLTLAFPEAAPLILTGAPPLLTGLLNGAGNAARNTGGFVGRWLGWIG